MQAKLSLSSFVAITMKSLRGEKIQSTILARAEMFQALTDMQPFSALS